VVEGLAVLAAIVFGYVQLKQFKQQRADNAAMELMRSLHDPEFIKAFQLISTSPKSKLESQTVEASLQDASFLICGRFEAIGQAAYRGSIPFHLIEELAGGGVVQLWQKIQPFIEGLREEQNYPQLFEWFQWLAEQLEGRGRTDEVPAFIREKQWRPTS